MRLVKLPNWREKKECLASWREESKGKGGSVPPKNSSLATFIVNEGMFRDFLSSKSATISSREMR